MITHLRRDRRVRLTPAPRLSPAFLVAVAAVAIAGGVAVNRAGRAAASPPPQARRAAPAIQPTLDPTGEHTIVVGLYLQNVQEIDIKTNSFSAELYLWFRWSGDIDPTLSYQLTNAVGLSELTATAVYADAAGAPAAVQLADGSRYQLFHIYGRFSHPFPVGRYPFDEHDIVISVEDAKHALGTLRYVVDHAASGMRPDLSVPGWSLDAVRADSAVTTYTTNFGDPRYPGERESYSRADFAVHIRRPLVGLVSKTVVPIALVILITFGAFFCQPEDIDARLCLTITALISAVALQFTAATELPPTGYLVLLDEIYLASYAVILGVSFCAIAANRRFHQARPDQARRIDRVGLVVFGVGYFAALFWLARA